MEPIKIENNGDYEIKHYRNGSHVWYKNGVIHREDGPAMIYASPGVEFYFLYGKPFEKEQWIEAIEKIFKRDCEMVYTLKQTGWRKGKPVFCNDKYFAIRGGSKKENEALAEKIKNMLNKEIVENLLELGNEKV